MFNENYVNSILYDFLHSKGFDCNVSMDTDFSYQPPDEDFDDLHGTIFWSPILPKDEIEKWFLEFAKSLNKNGLTNLFTLSFLHELGHHITLADFSTFRDKCSEIEKKLINILPLTESVRHKIYFRLPIERVATKWAVDFCATHPKDIEKLNKKLQLAFKEFYNGIEIEED